MLTFGITDDANGWPHSWRFRQTLAIAGGLCAETGTLAANFGHLIPAALLVLASSLAWTLLFASYSGLSRQQTRRKLLRWTLSVVLTTGYLLLLQTSRGFGRLGIQFGHHPAQRSRSQPQRADAARKDSGTSLISVHEAYAGIILWPKKQTYTKLVAPAPISFQQSSLSSRANPLIIPFDGVYWFYRAPDAHPPAKSRQAHGSPEMFDIRSTDTRPLSMEAHQSLGSLINLNCCSRIQVAVRNADRYPESVSLELILIDNTSPGKPSQSLGRRNINSTRPWNLYDDRPPTTETLSFAIPGRLAISRFNEIATVFHLDADRAHAGAKIGIDHFTLIPRGL